MNAPTRPPARNLGQSQALLAAYLDECRDSVAEIMRDAKGERIPSLRIQYTLAAAKLMHLSVEIVNALGHASRVSHHHVTVERLQEGGPPTENLQTIPGVPSEAEHQTE